MTPEQRKAASERMKKLNEKRKKNGEAEDLDVREIPPKNGELKKSKTANLIQEEAAKLASEYVSDGELQDIWQRRMLHPNEKPTKPIRLKTPGMHIRWINLTNNGRYQRARYEEGWVPVQRPELLDEREIYGVSFTVEGWVCRGEKQGEMLMKIPEAIYQKIRRAKIDEVHKSNKKIRESMTSAGAKHFSDKYNNNRGDEIASTMGNFKGEIKFGTEAVSPDAEEEALVASSIGE